MAPKNRTLMLGGLPYKLQYIKNLRDEDGTKLDGRVLPSKSTIQIDIDLDEQATLTTLWHEAIHVIMLHAGYRDHPEQLIETLSYGILSALGANKVLLP